MPVVFRHKGFRFYFFSNEGDPREPMRWPDVVVAYNDGFGARTLRELTEVITNRRREIANAWNEFFGEGD